ncbi:MAG: YqhA family protein, partial [Burkholderiaceae bacterium]
MNSNPLSRRVLGASRFLVVFAVLGSLVASVVLFVYGAAETVAVVIELLARAEVSSKGAKALALSFIEIVDLFLLGTVLLIIALGLYELFVDSQIQTPEWLHIRTLD